MSRNSEPFFTEKTLPCTHIFSKEFRDTRSQVTPIGILLAWCHEIRNHFLQKNIFPAPTFFSKKFRDTRSQVTPIGILLAWCHEIRNHFLQKTLFLAPLFFLKNFVTPEARLPLQEFNWLGVTKFGTFFTEKNYSLHPHFS